jgi:hypothetical protein
MAVQTTIVRYALLLGIGAIVFIVGDPVSLWDTILGSLPDINNLLGI